MKKIIILGSTGSIGTQSLALIKANPELFSVSTLACGSNIELLTQQIREFKPKTVVVEKEEDAKDLSGRYGDINVLWGREGLVQAAKGEGDLILNALVGMRGLEPTLSGIAAGKDIALANKETLVAGGELVMKAVKEKGVNLFPVDSEHSAIFQCLQGNEQNKVHRIILTASGGPFRDYAPEALEHVKLEHALRHPKWDMGPKITIDSATMMNKGLEVIEAKWLFDVDLDQIEVVVHPQSIVHSMVEYEDGAIMAQMGMPDMKVPISYAFTYPQRIVTNVDRVDFYQSIRKMTFEKPDMSKFSCIDLAYEAAKKGGSYPVVLNGANEVLVEKFLDRKINFMDIPRKLDKIMSKHKGEFDLTLERIIEIDKEAREETLKLIGR